MTPFERPGIWSLTTACFLLILPLADLAAAEDTIAAELAACNGVSDPTQRLACFDALAENIGQRQTAEIAVKDGDSAGQALPPLPDSAGQTKDADTPAEEYSGRIESCEKSDVSGRRYFIFDNGQVWRQSNTGRLPFRDCDFVVTLKRDMFGYKLEIPSVDRSVRVARVR